MDRFLQLVSDDENDTVYHLKKRVGKRKRRQQRVAAKYTMAHRLKARSFFCEVTKKNVKQVRRGDLIQHTSYNWKTVSLQFDDQN